VPHQKEVAVKIALFEQAPYRFLPEDFGERYPSSVVTAPYAELVEPARMYDTYRWYLEEIKHGIRQGYDAVAITEHGQATYDITPNPSLPAAILADTIREEGRDTALLLVGRSLGKTREPLRIAEEYAMLDCISGGRLVAGFPMGLSYDANINQGIPAVETRDRYREGHALVMKAWSSTEPFAWNGKYSQYAVVNPWPRPVQQPHPPVWVPGSGTPGTMAWTLEHDYVFVYLSWFGPTLTAHRIFDRYWTMAEERGISANPYRVGFVQTCAVGETDERAEREYGPYLEAAFRQGVGNIPGPFLALPGYVERAGVEALLRDPGDLGLAARLHDITFKELLETQAVIVGSPATVRDRIEEFVRTFRIGNLLVMLEMGAMPHELVLKNIELFATEVLPGLSGIWDEEGWEHEWWPTGIPSGSKAGAV
jgi:alkanesulfonate monooxygenase SsuD/methylene tetrahydromethanopterin reductase-like flavin-dependent oxidoreductase (luciferase family)